MKLPYKEHAYIPPAKLLDYLLSETHSVGKSKSKYLRSSGFNEANIYLLKQGLISIAQSEDISEVINTPYGVKYVIDGSIRTPVEIVIRIRTIWIVDKQQTRPRFVTAYPA